MPEILFSIGLAVCVWFLASQARMRRERIIVCLAITEALEACPEPNKSAAHSLAFDVAKRLNEKGWDLEL